MNNWCSATKCNRGLNIDFHGVDEMLYYTSSYVRKHSLRIGAQSLIYQCMLTKRIRTVAVSQRTAATTTSSKLLLNLGKDEEKLALSVPTISK